MVYKNKLTPLRPGGRIDKHEGKGSQAAPMVSRSEIKQLARGGSLNDYAKATPTLDSGGVRAPYGTYDLE